MIGVLLSLVLTTNCTAYGFNDSRAVLLKCDDAQRTELVIPLDQWPQPWREARVGSVYQLDSNGQAMESDEDLQVRQEARRKMLDEMKRWRRPAMQQPIP